MLLRRDARGVLAIGQSSHAWISGQLARAWGNERFPPPEPREEVCLAAELHDVGMAEWDLDPSLNPDTGLPHSFMEMPLEVHLRLWTAAPRRVLSQCPYAALLVSMHGARLYRMRDLESMARPDAEAVRAYLADEARFQEDLVGRLVAHPGVVEHVLSHNSQLVWTWDYLSLALCLNWRPSTARDVPVVAGAVDLELSEMASPLELRLEPWPLATDRLTVRCFGRRLEGRYENREALRSALAGAVWEIFELELVRGR
jgi:hypothetical protein